MVSINDCLNFIFEKCLRFKIKGRPVMLSWRDLNMVDRFFLIFKIHEITFPNGENKLMKTFECNACPSGSRYTGKHQVRGAMLQSFTIPDELKQFYHKEYRTFFIQSDKIGSFYLNMPTIGGFNLVKDYIIKRKRMGREVDKWFITVAPYLIEDYQSTTVEMLERMQLETNDWHQNKILFVTSAVDMLENSKNNKLVIKCPSCGATIEADIFSKHSFTIKNLFFISARLADLI
jgi:transcription elongation factor Elf1